MKLSCLLGMVLAACLAASAQTNSYTVTPIVNNTQDPLLVNPWGLSRPVSSKLSDNEWWVSDNATGYTTLYYANKTGAQSLAPLIISVATASGSGIGSPTGTVYNNVKGPGPGLNNFTYATLDGTISNWNAGVKPPPGGTGCYACHVTSTTVMVNNSSKKASYFGLTVATNVTSKKPVYYASNFNGGVETYDSATFAPVVVSGKFTDPKIPAAYKPYGIQTIGNNVWVSYFNGTSGGYVDAYDTNGNLKVRLARGNLSEPWGLVQAPANFGMFSNMLMVGNTTSGKIGAYNLSTGAFLGFLEDSTGAVIIIPGLWGISFGNGNVKSGPVNTLYYAAGGSQYATGVFGAITAN